MFINRYLFTAQLGYACYSCKCFTTVLIFHAYNQTSELSPSYVFYLILAFSHFSLLSICSLNQQKTCFLSLDAPHLIVFKYSFKPSLYCHCSLCPIRSLTQTLTNVSDFLLPFLPLMIDLLSFCQISLLLIPSTYKPLVVSYCM